MRDRSTNFAIGARTTLPPTRRPTLTEQRGDPRTNAKFAHLHIARARAENEARLRQAVADLYDESGLPKASAGDD